MVDTKVKRNTGMWNEGPVTGPVISGDLLQCEGTHTHHTYGIKEDIEKLQLFKHNELNNLSVYIRLYNAVFYLSEDC